MFKNWIKKKLKKNIEILNHNISILLSNKNTTYVTLLYHRILPYHSKINIGNEITLEEFEFQINYLKKNYDILDPNDLKTKGNKKKVLLTFDDGYKDNFLYAYPVLKKSNVSAIFFILPYFVNNNKLIWDKEILDIFNFCFENNKSLNFFYKKKLFYSNSNSNNINKYDIFKVINFLKKKNFKDIEKVINETKNNIGFNNINPKEDFCMTWDNLKEMVKNNMIIGSHGNYHLSYNYMKKNQILDEIKSSKNFIEQELKVPCKYFAFPFGSRDDFNQNIIDLILKYDFNTLFLNIHGNNKFDAKMIKRKIIYAEKDFRYLYG